MENSKISWTTHTFNPWIGCSKVNSGCTNCYAEEQMANRFKVVEWGGNGTRKRTGQSVWSKPRAWNRTAAAQGRRDRVFCASLADVFEDRTEVHPWRNQLFDIIDDTLNLDWLLLTKRPENITRLWPGGYRNNVWLGTSISEQATADSGIRLFQARHLSPVLFLSVEPLIGTMDLRCVTTAGPVMFDLLGGYRGTHYQTHWDDEDEYQIKYPHIDWVIAGGESGRNARRCESSWLEDIRHQCFDANVPFWMKQLGADTDISRATGKGDNITQWPFTLRVQELPQNRQENV